MKKWTISILACAVLLGAGWYLTHRPAEAVQYQTARVTRGSLTQLITATGTLNPVVNTQVGSQISGNVSKLYADFNSSVKANQIVAEIDPAIYKAIVHQAEGDLANSKAALELARLTSDRKRTLVAQHAAAQADLDTALATLHQAEATVLMKQANLEKAQVDLDHCMIYSPIDGTVISRAVDVGQTVAATMNAPVIFTVAKDLKEMQIDTNVAEADVGSIQEGQKVDFYVDAYPFRTFHGTVAQVRNAATTVQNVVTYDVVVSVKNDDLKLKPGMTTNIAIVVAQRDDVLKVSNAALRYRPPEPPAAVPGPGAAPSRPPMGGGGRPPAVPHQSDKRSVYLLPEGQGKPRQVQVKTGVSDGIATEIIEGLKEGDLAITSQTGGPPAAGQQNSNPLSGGMRFR